MPKEDTSLRKQLAETLSMKGAHLTLEEALSGFPVALRGKKPAGSPHSAWQLLEHMRISQEDILEFSRNPDYKEKNWPADYWPAAEAPPNEQAWDLSIRQFEKDLNEMQALIANAENNLFAKIPHGEGQTLLREALVLADHNSYHLGQLVFLRKTLETKV